MLSRRLRPARGQSLVETALILPLMLTLAFGVTDAGFAFFAYVQVLNSSREGARAAAEYHYQYHPSDSVSPAYTKANNDAFRQQRATEAARAAVGTLNSAALAVQPLTYTTGSGTDADVTRSQQHVTVGVTYPYTLPVTSAFGFLPSQINLSAQTTAMIRRQ